MNSIFIAQRELKASFRRPLAYVVILGFIALCSLYIFSLHPFFVINRSTVRPLFEFIPFALTFFVPAIGMGLIAEERRSGMLELLQTWPIGDGHLVSEVSPLAELRLLLTGGIPLGRLPRAPRLGSGARRISGHDSPDLGLSRLEPHGERMLPKSSRRFHLWLYPMPWLLSHWSRGGLATR